MKATNNNDYGQNNYLTFEVNEYILNELNRRFGDKFALTKDEVASVLNITSRTLSNKMSNKTLHIRHFKTGKTLQSAVMFPLFAVAEYLTNELCLAA